MTFFPSSPLPPSPLGQECVDDGIESDPRLGLFSSLCLHLETGVTGPKVSHSSDISLCFGRDVCLFVRLLQGLSDSSHRGRLALYWNFPIMIDAEFALANLEIAAQKKEVAQQARSVWLSVVRVLFCRQTVFPTRREAAERDRGGRAGRSGNKSATLKGRRPRPVACLIQFY